MAENSHPCLRPGWFSNTSWCHVPIKKRNLAFLSFSTIKSLIYRCDLDQCFPSPIFLFCILFSISWLKMLHSKPYKTFCKCYHPQSGKKRGKKIRKINISQRHFTAFTDKRFHCFKTPSEKLYNQVCLSKTSLEWKVGYSKSSIGLD